MKAPDNDVNKLSEEAAEEFLRKNYYELWDRLTAINVAEICEAMIGFTAASNKTAAGIDIVQEFIELYQSDIDNRILHEMTRWLKYKLEPSAGERETVSE